MAHKSPGKGAHTGFPAPGQGMLFRGTGRPALRFGTRAPTASQSWASCSPHGSGATAAPGTAAAPLRERTTDRGAWQRSDSCPRDFFFFFPPAIAALPHPPLQHNRGGRRPAGVVFHRGGRTGQAGVLTAHFGPGRAGPAGGCSRRAAAAGRGGAAPSGARPGPLRSAPQPLRAPPCPRRRFKGQRPRGKRLPRPSRGAPRSALYCNLSTVSAWCEPSHLAESFYVN